MRVLSDMDASYMSWWHVRVEREVDFRTFTYHCDQIQKDIRDTDEARKKAERKAASKRR